MSKTWGQVVYFGGDHRMHDETGKVRQGEKKAIKSTLLSGLSLCTTEA